MYALFYVICKCQSELICSEMKHCVQLLMQTISCEGGASGEPEGSSSGCSCPSDGGSPCGSKF